MLFYGISARISEVEASERWPTVFKP